MQKNNMIFSFGIGMFLILMIVMAMFTIPVSKDTNDITVDLIIYQPLIGDVQIKEGTAVASPHTLLSFGSILDFIKDVSDGDDFVITATAGGITVQEEVPAITRTYEITKTLKVKNVRNSETTVDVKLRINGNIVDEKMITIQ